MSQLVSSPTEKESTVTTPKGLFWVPQRFYYWKNISGYILIFSSPLPRLPGSDLGHCYLSCRLFMELTICTADQQTNSNNCKKWAVEIGAKGESEGTLSHANLFNAYLFFHSWITQKALHINRHSIHFLSIILYPSCPIEKSSISFRALHKEPNLYSDF